MRWPWAKAAPALTPEQREAIEKIPVCPYCAGRHAFACPYIAEMELEGGKLKRVRFNDKFAGLIEEILYL